MKRVHLERPLAVTLFHGFSCLFYFALLLLLVFCAFAFIPIKLAEPSLFTTISPNMLDHTHVPRATYIIVAKHF